MRPLMLFWVAAVVLLGWSQVAHARCIRRTLDIDKLAKQSPRAKLSAKARTRLDARFIYKPAILQPLGHSIAALWVVRGKKTARIYAGLARRKGRRIVPYVKRLLETTAQTTDEVDSVDEEVVRSLLIKSVLHDLDGDGRPELLVQFKSIGGVQPAAGRDQAIMLVALNLDAKLSLLGRFQVGWGRAHSDVVCRAALVQRTGSCVGNEDVISRWTCDKTWGKPTRESYRYDKGADRYVLKRWPEIKDGKSWTVIYKSFDRDSPRGKAAAESHRKALLAAGFSDAEIVDSNRFYRFRCCYWVVLGGRFATRKEAYARARALRAKKLRGAYVKQGY